MNAPSPETWSDEVRAIFQRIVDAMVEVAPPRWQRLELDTLVLGGSGQQGMYTVAADGSRTRTADTPGLRGVRALEELRALLYRPGTGTWYASRCSITDQGSFEIDLDYDNEPPWEPRGMSGAAYAADLASFPRSPDNIPPWLAAKLAEAALDNKKPS